MAPTKAKRMFQSLVRIVRWTSVPVLLIASAFSRFAGSYHLLLDLGICIAAILLAQRAVQRRDYILALGFGAIVIVFSPLFPVTRIFLLFGLAVIATGATLLASFRTRPVLSD